MMGRGLYAKLSDVMIKEADYWAVKRQENAIEENRTPGNNLRIPLDEQYATHELGCRTERAGKVCFSYLIWHAFKKGSLIGLPDLGDFIDVKGIPEDRLNLVVQVGGLRLDWAYLLISAENHPYYWLAGWMWGKEILDRAEIRFPGRPAYFIRKDLLHKPYLLQQIAKERFDASIEAKV